MRLTKPHLGKKSFERGAKILSVVGLLLVVGSLPAWIGACSPQPTTPSPADSGHTGEDIAEQDTPPTQELDTIEIAPSQAVLPDDFRALKRSDCPDVQSVLVYIVQNPNPLERAKALELQVKGDKIQVLLILASEDTSFLQNFQVELGSQSGTHVQAFVPANQLCDLAKTDEVLAVRLPPRVIPQH